MHLFLRPKTNLNNLIDPSLEPNLRQNLVKLVAMVFANVIVPHSIGPSVIES